MHENTKQLGRQLEQALTDEEAQVAIQGLSNLYVSTLKELAKVWGIHSVRKTKKDYLEKMYQDVYLNRKTRAIIKEEPIKPAVSQLD